ncbi:hypothetical protein PPL_02056 [Heterostelium album PN500]|uniref:Uncharacterized protein n=1 Tax=Heterostelium pallidum (strain ATCC 26659 / Pp 5 / PN500) TaxID=670386 RepID=D3B186_HETP5|nr:hypothetical protein PPL_02056 [Heterostelium album PN500]EFA85060.1 hypothetical protein PPL_02056 [Heterostelium album PN500]|eukprot:XP_020437170.1 hypothetical protein PPL_02056 [Heterostelium album PN500]
MIKSVGLLNNVYKHGSRNNTILSFNTRLIFRNQYSSSSQNQSFNFQIKSTDQQQQQQQQEKGYTFNDHHHNNNNKKRWQVKNISMVSIVGAAVGCSGISLCHEPTRNHSHATTAVSVEDVVRGRTVTEEEFEELQQNKRNKKIVNVAGAAALSGFMGYSAGYATKRLGRVVMYVVGILFIFSQVLSYYGYITIDWKKITLDASPKFTKEKRRDYLRRFYSLLTQNLPFKSNLEVIIFAASENWSSSKMIKYHQNIFTGFIFIRLLASEGGWLWEVPGLVVPDELHSIVGYCTSLVKEEIGRGHEFESRWSLYKITSVMHRFNFNTILDSLQLSGGQHFDWTMEDAYQLVRRKDNITTLASLVFHQIWKFYCKSYFGGTPLHDNNLLSNESIINESCYFNLVIKLLTNHPRYWKILTHLFDYLNSQFIRYKKDDTNKEKRPGQSKDKIPTWAWPRSTQVHVQNLDGRPGRVRMQAGGSPDEDNDLAPHQDANFSRSFGGVYLRVTNIGSTTLKVWTA